MTAALVIGLSGLAIAALAYAVWRAPDGCDECHGTCRQGRDCHIIRGRKG